MCVEYYTPIDIVSKLAMQRDYEKIYDFITITENNKYHGIVTIKELLEKAIQIEVQNAKHLNPLSGLPGNLVIEQILEDCVSRGKNKRNKCVIYLDLDNFKAYNDAYGFEKGDSIIKYTTSVMEKCIPYDGFKGHIGGDDFVAIVSCDDAKDICGKIVEEFDSRIEQFFTEKDFGNKFIISKNRKGIVEKFPLVSLSVAGIDTKNYSSTEKLTEDIAAAKKLCKQKEGSNYLLFENVM